MFSGAYNELSTILRSQNTPINARDLFSTAFVFQERKDWKGNDIAFDTGVGTLSTESAHRRHKTSVCCYDGLCLPSSGPSVQAPFWQIL